MSTKQRGLRPVLRAAGLFATFTLLGACSGAGGETASVRSAVVSGLIASQDGLTQAQVHTFKADVQGTWAMAYDPAAPPGCTAGGLWGAPDGPAITEPACLGYLLVRRKSRWAVAASGIPGTFVPPKDAPKGIGDPSRLLYLAP